MFRDPIRFVSRDFPLPIEARTGQKSVLKYNEPHRTGRFDLRFHKHFKNINNDELKMGHKFASISVENNLI